GKTNASGEPTRMSVLRRGGRTDGQARGPAASASEDGKFVPQHDDFQVLEVVRPNAQDRKLQYPPKRHVAEREEHETSEPDGYSLCQPRSGPLRFAGSPERET